MNGDSIQVEQIKDDNENMTNPYGNSSDNPYGGQQDSSQNDLQNPFDNPYGEQQNPNQADLQNPFGNPYGGQQDPNQNPNNENPSDSYINPDNPYMNAPVNQNGENPQNNFDLSGDQPIFDPFGLDEQNIPYQSESNSLYQDNSNSPYQSDLNSLYQGNSDLYQNKAKHQNQNDLSNSNSEPQNINQGSSIYQPEEDDNPYKDDSLYQDEEDNPYKDDSMTQYEEQQPLFQNESFDADEIFYDERKRTIFETLIYAFPNLQAYVEGKDVISDYMMESMSIDASLDNVFFDELIPEDKKLSEEDLDFIEQNKEIFNGRNLIEYVENKIREKRSDLTFENYLYDENKKEDLYKALVNTPGFPRVWVFGHNEGRLGNSNDDMSIMNDAHNNLSSTYSLDKTANRDALASKLSAWAGDKLLALGDKFAPELTQNFDINDFVNYIASEQQKNIDEYNIALTSFINDEDPQEVFDLNQKQDNISKAENMLRSQYEPQLRENVELIKKVIPDLKITEDDINEYLSEDSLKLMSERSKNSSIKVKREQNSNTFNKYWDSGITVAMFRRNAALIAKPETSAENKEYNEDLYEDINRNDARGMYAKKKFYAELLNQLIDFHKNELPNLDPKLHTPQEIAEYCRTNALRANMFMELVSMGGTTELTRVLLPKDGDQLKALTDYGQVLGAYMDALGTLAQSDYYVTFPHKNLDGEQLADISADPNIPIELKDCAANMIAYKTNGAALSEEIKIFNDKFSHEHYTIDDFNENPAADDPTMIPGGFKAHREALLKEIQLFEWMNNPYVDEYVKQLNDLKTILQTTQNPDPDAVMQLKEKNDALAAAIYKVQRNHEDLPEEFKLAAKNLTNYTSYFREKAKVLAGIRQDEQDALRDAAMVHGFAASDAELKEWFRQYKYDMRMSGQEDVLPKSSDLKAIREIFNKKYIEYMQTTPEYAQLKAESLTKLRSNIAEIKKMLPDFDLTEEQIEKCLSPEKLCVKLMSIKNPPKLKGDADAIKSFLPGGNIFPQYARSYFNVIKTDGTPEAEEYNKALMFDTQRLDKKGVEARKNFSAHMFNTMKNVDIGILTNKEDMSPESLSYCLYNNRLGNLSFEVFSIYNSNKEFVPKDPEFFEDFKAFAQGTGGYLGATSDLITSDNFLCLPHEYLNVDQVNMLMSNLNSPIYRDVAKMSLFIGSRDGKVQTIKDFTDKHSLVRQITKDDFVDGPKAMTEEFDYNKIRANVLAGMAKFPVGKTYPQASKFASEIAKIQENVQELYKAFSSDVIPDKEDLIKIVEIGEDIANWAVNSPKGKENPELREFLNDLAPVYKAMNDCKQAKEILNLAEYQKKDLPELVTYKNIFKAQAQKEAAFIEDCANTLNEIDSSLISSSQKFKDLKTAFNALQSLDENIAKLGYKNNLIMMKKRKDLMQDLSDKCRDYAVYKTKEAQQRKKDGKTPLSDYAAKRLDFAKKVAKIAGKQAVELDVNIKIAKNLINPNKTREEKQEYIASAEKIRTQMLDAIDHPVQKAAQKNNIKQKQYNIQN